MYSKTLLTLIGTFLFLSAYAGGIKGRISDENGEALSYATIYVKETKSGTSTNIDGFYEIQLRPGKYTFVFQYLGYESIKKEIQIGSDFTTLDIVLKQQVLSLDEVEVYDGRENPAYTIMRKAIAKSKFHLNQLDAYSVEVYVKGTGRITKIPWLLRGALERDGIDTDAAFVSESVSEVEFKRPNYFSEKLISRRVEGESNSTDPTGFINGSFYLPKVNGAVSPLSPRAFAYYRFEFLGSFFDQGVEVNKIKVTPRSVGENVFEGTLNIVEGRWAIHSLDLRTRMEGFDFKVKQIYEAIQERVWLPVSHSFMVKGTVLGIGFEYTYLATNGKYVISLNPALDVDITVIDEKIEPEKAKSLAAATKIETDDIYEKLSKGKELSNKELEKALKQYEKEELKETKEPEIVRIETYEVDSLADKRDSSYWNAIRPIPLNKYEIRGYEVRDSLVQVEKKNETTSVAEKFNLLDIVFGETYTKKSYTFKIHSPLAKFNFNTVEGFHFDYGLSYTQRSKNGFSTSVGATTRYAFNRDRLNGKGYLQFDFGERLKRGFFKAEGGRYISQYNENNPIHPFVNTLYTLLWEENYLKIYEKDFVKLEFEKSIWANFKLGLSAEWANRFLLENSSSNQRWVDRKNVDFTSNIPFYPEAFNGSILPESSKATVASLFVEYKPWQRYKIYNGEKQILDKPTPSFSLTYRKGIDGLLDSDVAFDHLEFGFKHQFPIAANDYLHMRFELGGFLNDKNMNIMDYKHFSGNRTIFVDFDPVDRFRLLDYYTYSTKDLYWNVQLQYHFRKFLFTRIPFIQYLGVRENLFANYLNTNTSNDYTEIGYSIDKIFRLFRLEFVSSFQEFKYQEFGVRIGIRTFIGDF